MEKLDKKIENYDLFLSSLVNWHGINLINNAFIIFLQVFEKRFAIPVLSSLKS